MRRSASGGPAFSYPPDTVISAVKRDGAMSARLEVEHESARCVMRAGEPAVSSHGQRAVERGRRAEKSGLRRPSEPRVVPSQPSGEDESTELPRRRRRRLFVRGRRRPDPAVFSPLTTAGCRTRTKPDPERPGPAQVRPGPGPSGRSRPGVEGGGEGRGLPLPWPLSAVLTYGMHALKLFMALQLLWIIKREL